MYKLYLANTDVSCLKEGLKIQFEVFSMQFFRTWNILLQKNRFDHIILNKIFVILDNF